MIDKVLVCTNEQPIEGFEVMHKMIIDTYSIHDDCTGIVWQIFGYFIDLYEEYNLEKIVNTEDGSEWVKRGYFPKKKDSPHYERRVKKIKKKYEDKRKKIDSIIEDIRTVVYGHSRFVIGDINLNKQNAIIQMMEDEKKALKLFEESDLRKAQSFEAYKKDMNAHYKKVLQHYGTTATGADKLILEVQSIVKKSQKVT